MENFSLEGLIEVADLTSFLRNSSAENDHSRMIHCHRANLHKSDVLARSRSRAAAPEMMHDLTSLQHNNGILNRLGNATKMPCQYFLLKPPQQSASSALLDGDGAAANRFREIPSVKSGGYTC